MRLKTIFKRSVKKEFYFCVLNPSTSMIYLKKKKTKQNMKQIYTISIKFQPFSRRIWQGMAFIFEGKINTKYRMKIVHNQDFDVAISVGLIKILCCPFSRESLP